VPPVDSPELLRAYGLFAFDEPALSALDRFYAELEQLGVAVGQDPHGALLPELVSLTAAEYALASAIAAPQTLAPIGEPIPVEEGHVRLSLVKANTNLQFCWPIDPVRRPLTLADITAFSGDLAKLAALGVHEIEPGEGAVQQVRAAVGKLTEAHLGAPSPLAVELATSGVLDRQGFLWAVKLSLPQGDVRGAMREAMKAFELRRLKEA
jgi:hypothetical protein